MNVRNGLTAAVIVILAVVAAIGWTRGRTLEPANIPVTNAQPADYNAAQANPSNEPPVYPQEQPEGYVNVIHRPVLIQQEPPPEPAYSAEPSYSPEPASGAEPGYRAEPVPSAGGPRHYYSESRPARHRSTKKSVAIVAGSAGVGAAVGALAGGGKGAGIGALAGGAGGFIYDRLTHNR